MTESPTILTSATGADFLAALPTLLGCTVRESVVVVPFHGTRTMGAMRMNLPPAAADPHDGDALGAVAVGAMSRVDDCDAVLLVVCTDETFPVAFPRWQGLIQRLDDAFDAAGFRVKDALCASADGWASWHEKAPPLEGHPLSEVDASPLAAQAERFRGGTPLPAHTDAAALPPREPELATALTAALEDLLVDAAEPDAFGRYEPVDLDDAVTFVEELLEFEPDDVPVRALARLAAFSVLRARRDEIVLQMAFGRAIGQRARREADELHEAQRVTGQSMDEVVAARYGTGRGAAASVSGGLFTGTSRRRPHVERMRRARRVLGRVIVNLPEHLQPDLRCMLAWLEWGLGSGTAAGAHVDAALRIRPDHSLAGLLHTLFSGGRLPEWVYVHRATDVA
ncbi:hypothetical protein GCM10022240_13090 [Microbacterium kribbense]|uniref:DUF4192 domain-containing protein n=1 Tax=Microbacterium kribbense TaxID=433645 RepID=A0ABP7GIL4_9MICO